MKKIIMVNSSLSGGGSERVMSLLANQLSDMGYQVVMILLLHSENIYTVNNSVKCINLDEKKGFFSMRFSRLAQLRKYFINENPDIIISFMRQINYYALASSTGLRKKVIVSERADPMQRNKIVHVLENVVYSFFADAIVFQTDYARKCYSKTVQNQGIVIPNPVADNKLPSFNGKRKKTIVSIGRMTEQKNFPMLICAFSKFVQIYPDYELLIYGNGPLMDQLKLQSSQLGIEKQTHFPGYVKELEKHICDAGMFVSASNFEGISNAMLEAMAMGLPSICTDCPAGGARLVIRNEENGVLITVNDEDALLCAMIKIASNYSFAVKLSHEAKKIKEEFSMDVIGNKWREIIER